MTTRRDLDTFTSSLPVDGHWVFLVVLVCFWYVFGTLKIIQKKSLGAAGIFVCLTASPVSGLAYARGL